MEMPEGFPDIVEIFVEIPRGSRNKYEFDEKTGVIRLNRVLSSAVYYNFDYGFIDGTRADDSTLLSRITPVFSSNSYLLRLPRGISTNISTMSGNRSAWSMPKD